MAFILIIAPLFLGSLMLVVGAGLIIVCGYHKDEDGDWTLSGDWARKILWTYVFIILVLWYLL